jgi:hypothetical protein
MSCFPITNSQVCKNRTVTILILCTSITFHHLEDKLMLQYTLGTSFTINHRVSYSIYIYIHLHAGYSFQRKWSSSYHTSIIQLYWIEMKQSIYLFLFTFFLRGIINNVRHKKDEWSKERASTWSKSEMPSENEISLNL